MSQRLRRALVAVSVSGLLVGGGATIAHAASATPSAKASTSSASNSSNSNSSGSNSANGHDCPDR